MPGASVTRATSKRPKARPASSKLCREVRGGTILLSRYLSYKDQRNFGTLIAVSKETAESEMMVNVEHYQTNAKDANFRDVKTFPFDEFERAAALYESYLVERLGVPPKQR
ncbi:hypothetical protein [Massilia phyllosphaerae]|uniref:hypothetical protein n=1 Tax=Massilia phyllosphaerae TaxID=3106034 RepID=UPI002B1CCDB8|nr:hypothetical protein [Massilia sp. SGZ-792]